MAIDFNPHPNPSCPWYSFAEKYGYPDVKWCEETLCSWISEPANTWSNVAYVLIAVLLWRETKKVRIPVIQYAPLALAFGGAASFLWHASNFYYTQIFDFVGAFSFPALLLTFNFYRLGMANRTKLMLSFFAVLMFHTLLMIVFYYQGIGVRYSAIPLVLMILLSELKCYRSGTTFRNLFFSIAFGVCGIIAVRMEADPNFCDPQNHIIQGHALWHVLTAAASYFAYKHYGQFRALPTSSMAK